MPEASRIQGVMIAAAAIAIAGAVALVRGKPAPSPSPAHGVATNGAARTDLGASGGAPVASVESGAATKPAATNHVLRTLPWGSGPGRVGLPEEDEAHAESPLRLAAAPDGVVLLDDENRRLVRLGRDGKPRADVRLPGDAHARDVAVAKDGSLFILAGEDADSHVTITTSDGRPRGKLAIDPTIAARSRSVLVSGNDVYVESHRGEITRIGDAAGTPDPKATADADPAPGMPMRDGRGWLTARIPNARTGTLHVYVVERESLAQRFSREIRPGVFVEGIPLVDSDESGTIYVVLTGRRDDAASATLLCIEPENGEVVGKVDLPIRIGPEVILDGRASGDGGVVYSVFTKEGMRVERHACP